MIGFYLSTVLLLKSIIVSEVAFSEEVKNSLDQMSETGWYCEGSDGEKLNFHFWSKVIYDGTVTTAKITRGEEKLIDFQSIESRGSQTLGAKVRSVSLSEGDSDFVRISYLGQEAIFTYHRDSDRGSLFVDNELVKGLSFINLFNCQLNDL